MAVSNNMLDFIDEIIPASHLVEGDDFEIVSFLVFNPLEMVVRSTDQYYGFDTLSLISDKTPVDQLIKREIARNNGEIPTAFIPTPYPNCLPSCFYKFSSPID